MFEICIVILMNFLAAIFFTVGFQLRHGKWLNLLAGNNFGEMPEDKTKKLGKSTGALLYFLCVFIFLLGLIPILDEKFFRIMLVLTVIITILGIILLIVLLWHWIRYG